MTQTKPKPRLVQSDFPYGTYFGDITLLSDLQVIRRDRPWRPVPPTEAEPHRVVLYLGCNILRTMHLVQTVVDIFSLLGLDHVVAAGMAYCCGIVPQRNRDLELAEEFGKGMVRKLQVFRPKDVVMWCPSCISHYDAVISQRHQVDFGVQHVTEFLVQHLKQLPFRPVVPQRVAVHSHVATPQRRREAECTRMLLSALPGIELVELGAEERLGHHCSYALINSLGREEWSRLVEEFLGRAVAAGVDSVVSVYHSCQRELCPFEGRYPFAIENYISVLGRSLGIEHEDKFKKYTLLADQAKILEEVLPCAQANHIALEKAAGVIQRTFLDQGGPQG